MLTQSRSWVGVFSFCSTLLLVFLDFHATLSSLFRVLIANFFVFIFIFLSVPVSTSFYLVILGVVFFSPPNFGSWCHRFLTLFSKFSCTLFFWEHACPTQICQLSSLRERVKISESIFFQSDRALRFSTPPLSLVTPLPLAFSIFYTRARPRRRWFCMYRAPAKHHCIQLGGVTHCWPFFSLNLFLFLFFGLSIHVLHHIIFPVYSFKNVLFNVILWWPSIFLSAFIFDCLDWPSDCLSLGESFRRTVHPVNRRLFHCNSTLGEPYFAPLLPQQWRLQLDKVNKNIFCLDFQHSLDFALIFLCSTFSRSQIWIPWIAHDYWFPTDFGRRQLSLFWQRTLDLRRELCPNASAPSESVRKVCLIHKVCFLGIGSKIFAPLCI